MIFFFKYTKRFFVLVMRLYIVYLKKIVFNRIWNKTTVLVTRILVEFYDLFIRYIINNMY